MRARRSAPRARRRARPGPGAAPRRDHRCGRARGRAGTAPRRRGAARPSSRARAAASVRSAGAPRSISTSASSSRWPRPPSRSSGRTSFLDLAAQRSRRWRGCRRATRARPDRSGSGPAAGARTPARSARRRHLPRPGGAGARPPGRARARGRARSATPRRSRAAPPPSFAAPGSGSGPTARGAARAPGVPGLVGRGRAREVERGLGVAALRLHHQRAHQVARPSPARDRPTPRRRRSRRESPIARCEVARHAERAAPSGPAGCWRASSIARPKSWRLPRRLKRGRARRRWRRQELQRAPAAASAAA